MSYEKQIWVTGDTITADKLNHMEDGISNRLLEVGIITTIEDGEEIMTLNKTWQEIYDAFPNVYISVVEQNSNVKASIIFVMKNNEQYVVGLSSFIPDNIFIAHSTNDYPTSRSQK